MPADQEMEPGQVSKDLDSMLAVETAKPAEAPREVSPAHELQTPSATATSEKVETPEKVETTPETPKSKFSEDRKALGLDVEKPVAKKAPEPAKEAVPAANLDPKTPKELRLAYEATKKERDTIRAELEAAKKDGSSKAEIEVLRKQLQEAAESSKKFKEQIDEREARIRLIDYRNSDEFQERYKKPLDQTLESAMQEVTQLRVNDPVTGEERNATPDDFTSLLQMDRNASATKARELFGDNSPLILQLSREVRVKIEAMKKADLDAKAAAETWHKSEAEKRESTTSLTKQTYADYTKERNEDLKELFTPDPADPAESKLIEQGRYLADQVMTNPAGLPPAKLAILAGEMSVRAAGFQVLQHRHEKAMARIAELEGKLKGYEDSEPSIGSGSSAPRKSAASSPEEEIDAMAGSMRR